MNNGQFSVEPGIMRSKNELQYVSEEVMASEVRYIFGSIDQKVASLDLRINLNLTPDLSIQYWGQPFIASAEYKDYKRITDYKASDFTDRFYTFVSGLGEEIYYDEGFEAYLVNESGGVSDTNYDYSFSKQDFNFKEFLSNLVVRWEYTPGSTLFIVWSQSRNGVNGDGRFIINEDLRNMFKIHPHNVFLIKLSYRFRI